MSREGRNGCFPLLCSFAGWGRGSQPSLLSFFLCISASPKIESSVASGSALEICLPHLLSVKLCSSDVCFICKDGALY